MRDSSAASVMLRPASAILESTLPHSSLRCSAPTAASGSRTTRCGLRRNSSTRRTRLSKSSCHRLSGKSAIYFAGHSKARRAGHINLAPRLGAARILSLQRSGRLTANSAVQNASPDFKLTAYSAIVRGAAPRTLSSTTPIWPSFARKFRTQLIPFARSVMPIRTLWQPLSPSSGKTLHGTESTKVGFRI